MKHIYFEMFVIGSARVKANVRPPRHVKPTNRTLQAAAVVMLCHGCITHLVERTYPGLFACMNLQPPVTGYFRALWRIG